VRVVPRIARWPVWPVGLYSARKTFASARSGAALVPEQPFPLFFLRLRTYNTFGPRPQSF
jgi:hypothetical protein